METIETRNGWTITGTITNETIEQVMIRVATATHGGIDCSNRVRPNMVIAKGNIKPRT